MKRGAASLVLSVTLAAPGLAGEEDGVGADVFDTLEKSATLADGGNRDRAITVLRDMLPRLDRPADIAQVSSQLAQYHMAASDWQSGRETLRTVVGLVDYLPPVVVQGSWNNLATATFQLGDYADVVRVVHEWHRQIADPIADSWRILCFAHFRQGQYERALEAGLTHADMRRQGGEQVPSTFASSLRFLRYAVQAQQIPDAASPEVADILATANQQIRAGVPLMARNLLTDALTGPDLSDTDTALLREKLAWVFQWLGDHERAKLLLAQVVESVHGGADLPPGIYNRTLLRCAGVSNRLGDHQSAVELTDEWRGRVRQPTPVQQRRFVEVAAIAHLKLGMAEGRDLGRDFLALLEETGEEIPQTFSDVWSGAGP